MKYNLSIGRIIGRLFITFFVSILFGALMFPFMRIADGLLFEQRAAIGNANMWKIVILWAIYSSIFLFFSFWKKRFRMVAVFLIVLWLLGTSIVIFLNYRDKVTVQRCLRQYPYSLPQEIDRALDLIAQRTQIEEHRDSVIGWAFNYRNCLDIQYSADTKSLKAEGAFLPKNSTMNDIKIILDPSYKQFDDLTIATILSHELDHVGHYVLMKLAPETNKIECFNEEAEAFTGQLNFIKTLNAEEQRSIYDRLRENIKINPAFTIFLSLDQMANNVYASCTRLKSENNLSDDQYKDCYWTGIQNNVKRQLQLDQSYIDECNQVNKIRGF